MKVALRKEVAFQVWVMIVVSTLFSTVTWAVPTVEIPINPIEEITPGDFCDENDKDFKEFRYPEQMAYCERNVSGSLKKKTYAKYHIPAECKHRYTIDHLVPLALGGNNAPENLWPEHVLVKETRQDLEQELYNKVIKGHMNSEDAVIIILDAKEKLQLDLSNVEGCG